VEGADLKLFASINDVMGSHHSGVGRRFFSVGLDLHTTGNTDQGFTTRQIGNVDESVIESGQNVSNSEDCFSFLKVKNEKTIMGITPIVGQELPLENRLDQLGITP
jgi:hypothetical protein